MMDWVWDVEPLPHALFQQCRGGGSVGGTHEASTQPSGQKKLTKYLVVGYAHNFIEVWHWRKKLRVHTLKSEPCILYCLAFHYQQDVPCHVEGQQYNNDHTQGRFLVAAGTVFNKILIWDIFGDGNPVYTLTGHLVWKAEVTILHSRTTRE